MKNLHLCSDDVQIQQLLTLVSSHFYVQFSRKEIEDKMVITPT
jgi:hypothetical protein